MATKTLRLLGDIHGDLDALEAAYSNGKFDMLVQLGDFGFQQEIKALSKYPPRTVRVLGGNHDEYPVLMTYSHYLGDCGTLHANEFPDVFFIRGAASIDRDMRIENVNWWSCEELSLASLDAAETAYNAIKPSIVLSHDGPQIFTDRLVHPTSRKFYSRTASTLSAMHYQHKPKLWVCGHWHQSVIQQIDGTVFCCLGINEFVDVEISDDGKITVIKY